MNAYLSLNGIELWHVAGWTMVHFLWLGALVAAAAAVCRFFLRRTSPNIRYAFMLAWLIALAALPLGTAAWLWEPSPTGRGQGEGVLTATVPTPPIIELHNPSNHTTSAELAVPSPPTPNQPLSSAATLRAQSAIHNPQSEIENAPATSSTLVTTVESCIPYLPWLWLIGTPITFALLLTGVVGTRRLGRASRTISDGAIAEMLARLIESLHIGKCVTVAVCDRIAAPVLIGILRPIILLPPAALTGWSPDEIEMVLLHELAHVRRWDNLMNLLQRLVESLLFFHPAVWLISSWVRSDREACCDAVVVTRTNRPHAYAEMLVALAAQMPRSVLFHPAASSAMAAGPLRSRIRRILQLEDDPMLVSGKSFVLMLAALVVVATLAVLYAPTIGQAEQPTTEATESTEKKAKTEQSSDAADTALEPLLVPQNFALKRNKAGETRLYLNGIPIGHDVVSTVISKSPNLASKVRVTISVGKAADSNEVEKLVNLLKSLGVKKLAVNSTLDEATSPADLTADDHWPAGIVFASPKEGEISARVWRELGIKIVPATKAEQTAEHSSSLKVIQVRRTTGTMSLDRMLLLSLNGVETNDFDQLADAVNKLKDANRVVAKCAFHTPQGPTFTDIALELPATRTGAASPWPNQRSTPEASAKPSSKFPSLEDQKLADRAWKSLSLELEPIGADELKRVKALGYDGGVKVVSGSAGLQGLVDKTIQPGDILVGLHVWPTKSMKDVATVLDREDLAELNPLKFYVVREESTHGARGEPSHQSRDVVRTGRVSVQIGNGFGGRASSNRIGSTSTQPSTSYQAPTSIPTTTQPLRDHAPPPKTPPSALPGPTHGSTIDAQPDKSNLRYDDKSFDEWRNAWKTELSNEKRSEAVKALAAFGRAGFGKEATAAILDVAGEYDFLVLDGNQNPEGKLKETVLAELAPEYPAPKLATFWVPDLAARLEKDPKKWKWLAEHLSYRLVTDDPDVLGKLQTLAGSGPAELRGFALGALVKSARSKKPGAQVDDKTRDLIDAALQSKNIELVRSTLFLLPYYSQNMGGGSGGYPGTPPQPQLLYRPALLPLLFDADEQTGRQACRLLQSISEEDAPDVAKYVLAVLKDKTRERDHIDAVRAFAAMGGRAEGVMKEAGAVAELQKLAKQASDDEMFIATLVALNQINGPSDVQRGGNQYDELRKLFDEATTEEIGAISQRILKWKGSFKDQFQKELEVVLNLPSPKNQVGGGGGGFF